MKLLIWSLCAIVAAFWTGAIVLAVYATDWMAAGLASGQIKDFASGAAQWPIPAGLPAWIDPQWVQTMQTWLATGLNALANVSPQLSSVVSWLVTLLWLVWVMGMVSLLGLTGGAHWLIGRLQRHGAAAA